MRKKLLIAIFLIVIAGTLFAISYSRTVQRDKAEITAFTDTYMADLSKQLRTNGVASIDVSSREINVKPFSAVAKLSIVFNIYNPSTKQRSEMSDNVTFIFKRAFDGLKIERVDYEKTKW